MRVVLSCEVPVERFAVFAEMAWFESRPELGWLCRTARGDGDRISSDAVRAALPGVSEAGAANVIQWCTTLGLCDAGGALTCLGEDVAETDEAPVPEQGVYGFWLAQHPVLGRRLLEVQRLASRRDARFEDVEPLEVGPDCAVVFRSVLNPKQRFVVRDLPTNNGHTAVVRLAANASCRLRWTLDFETEQNAWQLDGSIDAQTITHDAEHEDLDLWSLAAAWGTGPLASMGRWDPHKRRLGVAFGGLGDDEQDRFIKTVELPRVEIPGKGGYDDVTLEDVPIGPATAIDAQRWAMARFDRRLLAAPRYRSRDAIRELFVALTQGTALAAHAPILPSHERCIGGDLYARQPEVFWNLAAPVDLAPCPPTREMLAEARFDASTGGEG